MRAADRLFAENFAEYWMAIGLADTMRPIAASFNARVGPAERERAPDDVNGCEFAVAQSRVRALLKLKIVTLDVH